MTFDRFKRSLSLAAFSAAILCAAPAAMAQNTLLNVSYDPTRELYQAINASFLKRWQAEGNPKIDIRQSHGGSGAQARAVIDGLQADVVTLALAPDIDEIAKATKKLPEDWQTRLPNNSSPYTSTIVLLVRKGNPKGIKDWDDLAKPGVKVITPNPKTSGGARWNFLAAWGYQREKTGDENKAEEFVSAIYKNVPVLDTGARGSTTTFVQRGIGDVMISWENEAFLALNEFGKDKLEIVIPSVSIRAEPPVALVDKNADNHKTRKVAEAYLQYLYTPEAQKIVAKNYYRPYKNDGVDPEDLKRFPEIKQLTIQDFGGWSQAQAKYFNDGGVFDKIYKPSGK
jgi:sulfate/thiosulfate-binding protein